MERDQDRRLTYLFLTLPYHDRLRVVVDLMLVRGRDEGLSAAESWKAWLARAKQEGAMQVLSAHISHACVNNWLIEALLAHPQGGAELSNKIKHIMESEEYREWKAACR